MYSHLIPLYICFALDLCFSLIFSDVRVFVCLSLDSQKANLYLKMAQSKLILANLYSIVLWTIIVIVNPSLGQQNGEPMVSAPQINNKGQLSADYLSSSSSLSLVDDDKQVKIQYVNVNGLPVLVQFTFVGPPKILPIATADSYPEGSSINLICTVSGGQRRGLVLSWRANGEELDAQKLRDLEAFDNVSIGTDEADISILRIKNATSTNSGQYTCTAKNPLGQDSTSVKIVINGMFAQQS